jgi:hypothetical protein
MSSQLLDCGKDANYAQSTMKDIAASHLGSIATGRAIPICTCIFLQWLGPVPSQPAGSVEKAY